MSKYTAEQVESFIRTFNERCFDSALLGIGPMLSTYAAHLRDGEAAKAGVTDEIAKRVAQAAWDAAQADVSCKGNVVDAVRAALEAVAPMLASARPIDAETVLDEYVRICAAEHAEHAAAADRVDAMRRALAHAGAASARVPDGLLDLIVRYGNAREGVYRAALEDQRIAQRDEAAAIYADIAAALAAAPKPETE